jgi:hypothetical protein
METIVRLKGSYRRIGIVSLAGSSAMLIVSTVGWSLDTPDHRGLLGVLVIGSIWTSFVGLSVWLILAYQREVIREVVEAAREVLVIGAA